ncbi:alpha/beta fold hydrolase [Aneurinibacillus tyrosinisolvens]|uniref:alpha/beta fold hydrolase n=1 Tax=Aneurinibacillus tyrosinisolvens TaxID=1443435 RepID=UPI00063FC742|nr:alpha/beta hydrolase [Aneurinibacillus tyrosinisolvens]
MSQFGSIPFLFIHGAAGSKDKFRGIEQKLEGIPCLFVDLPGHGENAGEACCASIEEYAQWLNGHIGRQPVIVVGHSMGGMIGMELAAHNPYVKGLVLTASHYELPVHPKLLLQLVEGTFPASFFRASYGKNVNEDLLEEEQRQRNQVSMQVAHNDFSCCNDYKGKASFAALKIPVLALYGSEDRLLPAGALENAKETLPDAQCEVIEGAGHYVMLENPEAFVQALLAFRKSIASNLVF